MKIISTGSEYKIYGNNISTYDKLPAQAYAIEFNPTGGFSLVPYQKISVNEKTYGVHQQKVEKVKNSFLRSTRNMGVILSGDKGIGKSLFAKMLAAGGLADGYPVIVVEQYIPGIAAFINSIEQEVYVLFDEFDKTFNSNKNKGDASDPQTEMLGLFDGISISKKLFIITCNSLVQLSDFLVNRPGRFHYHFRFNYPGAAEIEDYLKDRNIPEAEIEKVINFSAKVRLNYDCLRAISFELETGETFENCINDLNIVNTEYQEYNIIVHFKNGQKLKCHYSMDLFSDEDASINFRIPSTYYDGYLDFIPSEINFDTLKGCYKIDSTNGSWSTDEADNRDSDKDKEQLNLFKPEYFDYALIRHKAIKNIHYTV